MHLVSPVSHEKIKESSGKRPGSIPGQSTNWLWDWWSTEQTQSLAFKIECVMECRLKRSSVKGYRILEKQIKVSGGIKNPLSSRPDDFIWRQQIGIIKLGPRTRTHQGTINAFPHQTILTAIRKTHSRA